MKDQLKEAELTNDQQRLFTKYMERISTLRIAANSNAEMLTDLITVWFPGQAITIQDGKIYLPVERLEKVVEKAVEGGATGEWRIPHTEPAALPKAVLNKAEELKGGGRVDA